MQRTATLVRCSTAAGPSASSPWCSIPQPPSSLLFCCCRAKRLSTTDYTHFSHLKNIYHLIRRIEGQGTMTERRKNRFDPSAYPPRPLIRSQNRVCESLSGWLPANQPRRAASSRPSTAPAGGRPASAGAAAAASKPHWDDAFIHASRDRQRPPSASFTRVADYDGVRPISR